MMIYSKVTGIEVVDEYLLKVLNKEIVACEEQIAFAKHIANCFANESISIYEDRLERYLALQKYFEYKLFDWEITLFALQFCTYTETGDVRWRRLVLLSGRGTGKNGYLAFVAFAMLSPINPVKKYNIDIYATSEEQARTSFDDVYIVCEENEKKLTKHYYWTKESIHNYKTRSYLKYKTASHKTKDGGRPGLLIFDEYHAYENYKLITVAKTGLGKTAEPRSIIATTDGEIRNGPLDDEKENAKNVLFENHHDNGTLYCIFKVDDIKEIHDEKMWHKANPSLRFFKDLLQEMRAEYIEYKKNPQSNRAFVLKRMNIVIGLEENNVTSWENIQACNRELPDLQGKNCVFGIDYAKTTDFVAAGLLFKVDDMYYWITKSWVCDTSPDLERIQAPLENWEEDGLLEYVPGPEIAPEIPVDWLLEQMAKYNIGVGGLDNFRITLMKKALEEAGFEVDFKKKSKNKVYLNKRVTVMKHAPLIESIFNSQKLVWGINPLMNWYVNNTYVKSAGGGNMVYEKKEEKSRKTDGFMALVNAICVAEYMEEENSYNYEDTIIGVSI